MAELLRERYELVEVVGHGGEGRVVKALDRQHDRTVALKIRAAAPDTEIVLVVFYNPFMVSNPGTDGLWRRYYTSVEKDAARRKGVRVAEASEVVHRGNVCRLTFTCGSGDVHPTDAGYARIADLIFHVAGFEQELAGSA